MGSGYSQEHLNLLSHAGSQGLELSSTVFPCHSRELGRKRSSGIHTSTQTGYHRPRPCLTPLWCQPLYKPFLEISIICQFACLFGRGKLIHNQLGKISNLKDKSIPAVLTNFQHLHLIFWTYIDQSYSIMSLNSKSFSRSNSV